MSSYFWHGRDTTTIRELNPKVLFFSIQYVKGLNYSFSFLMILQKIVLFWTCIFSGFVINFMFSLCFLKSYYQNLVYNRSILD